MEIPRRELLVRDLAEVMAFEIFERPGLAPSSLEDRPQDGGGASGDAPAGSEAPAILREKGPGARTLRKRTTDAVRVGEQRRAGDGVEVVDEVVSGRCFEESVRGLLIAVRAPQDAVMHPEMAPLRVAVGGGRPGRVPQPRGDSRPLGHLRPGTEVLARRRVD